MSERSAGNGCSDHIIDSTYLSPLTTDGRDSSHGDVFTHVSMLRDHPSNDIHVHQGMQSSSRPIAPERSD